MKRWHWIFLALSPFLVAAILLIPPRLGGGTEQVQANGGLSLSLDMDVTDGGPCADIDDSAVHSVGDSYDVAVCIGGMSQAIGSFYLIVTYDDTLNSSPNESCPSGDCFDANPDANAGTTTWGTSLGSGWDCNIFDLSPPQGDRNLATGPANGEAYLGCWSLSGPYTFGDNETSGVLALISFTAIAGSPDPDTLSLADSSVSSYQGVDIGVCGGSPAMSCNGATDEKAGTPAPTATATWTPTATRTPCPNGICPTNTPTPKAWTKTPTPPATGTPTPAEPGEPAQPPPPPPPPPTGGQLPQVVPPATGSGPDGIPWASTAVWLLAAAGAFSVSLGGLYLRRARHR